MRTLGFPVGKRSNLDLVGCFHPPLPESSQYLLQSPPHEGGGDCSSDILNLEEAGHPKEVTKNCYGLAPVRKPLVVNN